MQDGNGVYRVPELGDLCPKRQSHHASNDCVYVVGHAVKAPYAGGVKDMVRTILAIKNAKAKSSSHGTSRRKSSIVPAREFSDDTHTRRVRCIHGRRICAM